MLDAPFKKIQGLFKRSGDEAALPTGAPKTHGPRNRIVSSIAAATALVGIGATALPSQAEANGGFRGGLHFSAGFGHRGGGGGEWGGARFRGGAPNYGWGRGYGGYDPVAYYQPVAYSPPPQVLVGTQCVCTAANFEAPPSAFYTSGIPSLIPPANATPAPTSTPPATTPPATSHPRAHHAPAAVSVVKVTQINNNNNDGGFWGPFGLLTALAIGTAGYLLGRDRRNPQQPGPNNPPGPNPGNPPRPLPNGIRPGWPSSPPNIPPRMGPPPGNGPVPVGNPNNPPPPPPNNVPATVHFGAADWAHIQNVLGPQGHDYQLNHHANGVDSVKQVGNQAAALNISNSGITVSGTPNAIDDGILAGLRTARGLSVFNNNLEITGTQDFQKRVRTVLQNNAQDFQGTTITFAPPSPPAPLQTYQQQPGPTQPTQSRRWVPNFLRRNP